MKYFGPRHAAAMPFACNMRCDIILFTDKELTKPFNGMSPGMGNLDVLGVGFDTSKDLGVAIE